MLLHVDSDSCLWQNDEILENVLGLVDTRYHRRIVAIFIDDATPHRIAKFKRATKAKHVVQDIWHIEQDIRNACRNACDHFADFMKEISKAFLHVRPDRSPDKVTVIKRGLLRKEWNLVPCHQIEISGQITDVKSLSLEVKSLHSFRNFRIYGQQFLI
jgi:hypothetical protein